MIFIYSVQNPIDLNPTVWSFDSSVDKFYNWKNTPVQGLVKIPNKAVKLQMNVTNAAGQDDIDSYLTVYNAETGEILSAVAYTNKILGQVTGVIFEYIIDLSLIPAHTKFYIEVEIYDQNEDETDIFNSSCYKISVRDDDKLIRIEFGNTVNNRQINGILFDEDATFDWYIYANKYDTEVEIVDNESENDYKGNTVLVEKTHSETDVFEIVDMPKKLFMGLVAISENDEIKINGRRANFTFEKVTESRVGTFEICFINAFMRVTYADDNGLLDVRNIPPESLMLIDSDNYLNIDSDNKLKNR